MPGQEPDVVLNSYYACASYLQFFAKRFIFGRMEEMDDQRLVELLRESNYPAFDEIHVRYWKYIYTIAYAKTGDKDHAFDLCQSVFIDLFQKREKLEIA